MRKAGKAHLQFTNAADVGQRDTHHPACLAHIGMAGDDKGGDGLQDSSTVPIASPAMLMMTGGPSPT